MVVAMESSTLKSAPAHCIFSALTKTVSGSYIPESVEDLANLITGKFRVPVVDSLGDKAGLRGLARSTWCRCGRQSWWWLGRWEWQTR